MSILTRTYIWRVGALLVGTLIALHLLLSATHPSYSVYTPLYTGHRSKETWSSSDGTSEWQYDEEQGGIIRNATGITRRKANAVFVILVRNSELWDIVSSIRQLEDRFNWWANYDYVFLNDEPFDEKFKTYTRKLTKANCQYGLIEPSQWKQPEWIDEEKARAAREVS
ncbi:hypothetical protein QFC24_000946 [Naganishia onofrii]|uniref:Uncharacterized protein n=1 Tax=Naganishia onofrii TaxID=1851511 RepID=A0ACC2XU77_9TREE|nr:hypothetical protein QFC24_000946 [Naganishia onofrii]